MIREEYYGTGNIDTHRNWNDAAGVTNTLVKGAKTLLLSIDAQNTGGAAAYLHLFDKATAPVAGTDTPKLTYLLPAAGGKVNEKNMAVEFSLGFGYAITSGAGDTDSTNVTNADEVVVNFEYFAKF
ncbi:MAG: hypothetical protein IH945_02025 [Armatimonadetes bacterium]|nr:hypothetical protein [Armatimonadota bacterium]